MKQWLCLKCKESHYIILEKNGLNIGNEFLSKLNTKLEVFFKQKFGRLQMILKLICCCCLC